MIGMLRELDADIWETIACCFRYRLLNHCTECDDERLQTDCDAADILRYILQDAATVGERHPADKNWSPVWSRSRSSSSRSGVDAQENGGAGYRVANPDFRDGL